MDHGIAEESILFFGGEGREVQRAEGALQERQASEWKRLAAKDVVQLVQDQYRQALSLSPSLVLVPLLLLGWIFRLPLFGFPS